MKTILSILTIMIVIGILVPLDAKAEMTCITYQNTGNTFCWND